MIDFGSDTPLHVQVADVIRESINGGVLRPGDYLRAEADMEGDYGVGQSTIRKALTMLAAEGLIIRRKGYRAQVMPEVETDEVVVAHGSRLKVRMPTPAERREWRLPMGVPVLEVRHGGEVTVYPGDRSDFTVP